MKLICRVIIVLAGMLILTLTSCTLLPQTNSNSQPIDENQIIETKSVNNDTPISTEVSYTFQRENPLKLPPSLTVEEYALIDQPLIEPLTFHPVRGTVEDILARRYAERLKTYLNNSFFNGDDFAMRAGLSSDELVARQQYNETGSEGWVTLTRNGKEIYRIDTGPAGPLPIAALRGLWVYDDHWVLETAKIVLCQECSEIIKEARSQTSLDGNLLNDLYNYREMFNFQVMAGKPFYFFTQDSKINFSFDGQVVLAGYDEVPHYGCCSSASLNPVSAENMVAFFAKRGSLWYYVEIGVYQDDVLPQTPSPEAQPCLSIRELIRPEQVARTFLEQVSESDLQEARNFWIQEVWDGGIDQLVTSWANGEHDFTIGTTTYEGFFAPGDYRPMEADNPRVSGALVTATIDGEQGSFALKKTCETWLLSGWVVPDKMKE
jgi:hypothetical protein